MSHTLDRLTIEGYKSIRKLEDFELRSLNVLIGANGAGKSNFVGLFRMLRALTNQNLERFIRTEEGGADTCLHLGPKNTREIAVKLRFGMNGYEFILVPTTDNKFVFDEEAVIVYGRLNPRDRTSFGSGHYEAKLKEHKDDPGRWGTRTGPAHYVFSALSGWVVYHFHDTSNLAGVRRQGEIIDDETLRHDAANLAAFLYRIRRDERERYDKIRDVVRLIAPFFEDFRLRPVPGNEDKIQLEWLQKGSDYPLRANQLSDGTVRFICLATALLQPNGPPTVLFDEPELGLHPYALTVLAGLFRQVTERKPAGAFQRPVTSQVIVSTQSAQLLNEFEPKDVIVVEREHSESIFRRLEEADLSEWLQEYSLGELWQKNILGGRPAMEKGPELVDAGAQGGDGRS